EGCRTALLTDGSACGGTTVCERRVCTAGVCGGAGESVAAGGSDPDDRDTKLTLKRTANGLEVHARSSLEGFPGSDLAGHEVLFVVRDATGANVFEARVSGDAFTASGDDRAVFREDHRDDGGGFTEIEIQNRRGGTGVVVAA